MTGFGPIPDGTNWVDAYGRIWYSNGTDMLLWADPTVTIIGDNPQKIVQDSVWNDPGATAADITGADITGSIVVDTGGLDTAVPGSYMVTYTATDSEGYTTAGVREVIVLNVDRPDVRQTIHDLLEEGLPNGLYVYATPAEQVKVPAVVVSAMSWTPGRMASLKDVEWDIDIAIIVARGVPEYTVLTLETVSRKVAQLLIAANFTVNRFDGEGSLELGGSSYLAGTLNITYRERNL